MIKVYVGTYAKYNAGSIAGAWLDLSDYADKDEFLDAAQQLHADEEDPELMYQDREFDHAELNELASECHIDDNVWRLFELDEHALRSVRALLHDGRELEYALDNHEDVTIYACDYEHKAASVYFDEVFCEIWHELVEQLEASFTLAYIDQDAIWRDAQASGYQYIDGIGIVDFDGV